MARAIWKGSISFGLVNIPVGLFTAEERDELSFRQLDRRNLSPVGYKKYNKANGKDVPSEEIVKGYEYEPDQYVVISDEDFRRANPEATQTVEITDFVDLDDIDPVFYDKPYYLAPLAKSAKGYALLRETLKRTGKVGIARVVIRSRQYLAAVIPQGRVLLLEILRFPYEIRPAEELELPGEDLKSAGVSPKELEMAEKLVEAMADEWSPEKYHDEYRDDLLALIRRRVESGETAEGEPVPEDEAPARTDVIDIMSVLKRSVEAVAKDRKPAAKASSKPAAKASASKAAKPASRSAAPKKAPSTAPAKRAQPRRKSA